MNFYLYLLYFVFLIASEVLFAGNIHTKASAKNQQHYLKMPLKNVPSLKILAAHAVLTFKKPKEYPDKNKLSEELVDYLEKIKKYLENDYASALLEASTTGSVELVRDLIFMGVSINQTNENNITPLITATRGGYSDIVKILVENGADVDIRSSLSLRGATALMQASFHGYQDICEYLIDIGAQINLQSYNGCTALTNAAWLGHESICKLLLDHNARIDLVNAWNNDALHLASKRRKKAKTAAEKEEYTRIMKMLLDAEDKQKAQ